MKIKVDRQLNDDELVFTITITEPQFAPYTDDERLALESIDRFTKNMERSLDPQGKLYHDILVANHDVKEKVFTNILDNLKFSIENEFRPKFRPICQEIYNWIYDNQEGFVKKWMTEFDPQRTKYYFDNDAKSEYGRSTNLDPDDKEDDE